MSHLLRSMLFVPGNRIDRADKALRSGADAIVFDLEDSVPASEQVVARDAIRKWLEHDTSRVPIFARIHGVAAGELAADLCAVTFARLAGVILPDADDPDHVRLLDEALMQIETERKLETGGVVVLAMPETARGISRLGATLDASERVIGTIFAGAPGGDLRRDLGAGSTPGGLEILYVRSRVLFEARAAGKAVVLDGVFPDLADASGLAQDTLAGRQIGYTGRIAIHPAQLETINRIHSPSREEVDAARELILAYERACRQGAGAIRHKGRLVDLAMARQARNVIDLADRIGSGDSRMEQSNE